MVVQRKRKSRASRFTPKKFNNVESLGGSPGLVVEGGD